MSQASDKPSNFTQQRTCTTFSAPQHVGLVNIPCLFLQNEMRLHEELDPQPQSTRRHIIHLLADSIPQIQPQVLALAARELQPKVVHFNYAQLPTNLVRDENEGQL